MAAMSPAWRQSTSERARSSLHCALAGACHALAAARGISQRRGVMPMTVLVLLRAFVDCRAGVSSPFLPVLGCVPIRLIAYRKTASSDFCPALLACCLAVIFSVIIPHMLLLADDRAPEQEGQPV